MAPSQSSKMFQNALCFLPKTENDENVAGKPDHGKPNFELPSILNFGRSGRWSGSGRRQQEQVLSQRKDEHLEAWENGLQQHLQEAHDAPRRSSFSLLADQIQSVSQRFALSINLLHNSSRRKDPDNMTTIATDDGKRDGHGDVGNTFETVAVPTSSRNELQAPSELIKLDVDGDVKGDLGSPVYPVTTGKKKLPAASTLMKLITRRSDEKQQQSALKSSMSPKSSHRLNEADEKTLALMLAPVPDPDDDDDDYFRSDLQIEPQQQQKRQQEKLSVDLIEKSGTSDEECNILRDSTSTSSPKEIVLESNLGAPTVDEEKGNANKHVARVLQVSPLLRNHKTNLMHPIKATKEIPKPQQDKEITEIDGGESFDFWNGTSIKPDSGGIEEKGPCPWNRDSIQATPDLQPKKIGLANHNSNPPTTKENDKGQENIGGESEGEGGPPFRFHMTSPNPGCGGGPEQSQDPWALGSWSPGSRHTMSDTELRGDLGDGFYTPRLSLDASEIGARLPILFDQVLPPASEHVPPAAEQVHPLAPDAAVTSTVRSPSRKFRFTADGDNDLTAFDNARYQHLPETVLGKLTTARRHQIRYLQDELEQTRAHVAELELNCEAQKDLKLAFKVQAVRIGAALKNLREFALENGLDPRGVDPSFVTPSAPPKEVVGQASDTEYITKEINSSPKLDLLKAEAERFSWLCDPQEVTLREYIGSGSSAEIFKAVWHNLDVAVKCVRPNLFGGNTEEAIAAFCQEVEIQSRQRHPYILRMFAACLSPPDRAWIVTEYLPSGTLTEWLHGTKIREKTRIVPLPPMSERLRIATEISIAMQYLHKFSPKVLHRDLKPSNILLDENKHVRIADFNCARFVTDKDAILTGETGTYVYMAPEVMAHECYDQMCDVYSFAVVLCELVTGNPPYIDTNYSPAEIACKVAQGTLRPTLPENHPAALMLLIQSAWEQDPRKRPSFSEITGTLNIIAQDFKHAEHFKYAEEPSTDAFEKTLLND